MKVRFTARGQRGARPLELGFPESAAAQKPAQQHRHGDENGEEGQADCPQDSGLAIHDEDAILSVEAVEMGNELRESKKVVLAKLQDMLMRMVMRSDVELAAVGVEFDMSAQDVNDWAIPDEICDPPGACQISIGVIDDQAAGKEKIAGKE